jgi:hypothetical protein
MQVLFVPTLARQMQPMHHLRLQLSSDYVLPRTVERITAEKVATTAAIDIFIC